MNRRFASDDMTWTEYTEKNGPMSLEMVLQVLSRLCWQLRTDERSGKKLMLPDGKCVRVSVRSGRAYAVSRREKAAAAPELLRSEAAGSWTNVYLLAALILQGLTGKEIPHPLERASDDTAVQKYLDALNLSMTEKETLRQALMMDPAQRYTTVNAFLDAMGEMPMGTAREEPQRKPIKTGKQSALKVMAAVLPMLLIGMGLLGYYAIQSDRYRSAAAYLETFNFSKAEETIASVPDWIHADVVQIRDLAQAGVMFEKGDYLQAKAQLERLGSFSVAPVILEKTEMVLSEQAYTALTEEIAVLVQKGRLTAAWEMTEAALAAEQDSAKQAELICFYGNQVYDIEQVLTLYERLEPYKTVDGVKVLRSKLLAQIYEKGENAFRKGNREDTVRYLTAAGQYKKAETYLNVLASQDPDELIEYMGNPLIEEKLYSADILEKYLRGTWTGSGYTLSMDETASVTTDLPWGTLEAEYYELNQGVVIQEQGAQREKCFAITIVNMDKLKVYSYALDKTITMKRK